MKIELLVLIIIFVNDRDIWLLLDLFFILPYLEQFIY